MYEKRVNRSRGIEFGEKPLTASKSSQVSGYATSGQLSFSVSEMHAVPLSTLQAAVRIVRMNSNAGLLVCDGDDGSAAAQASQIVFSSARVMTNAARSMRADDFISGVRRSVLR